MTGSFGHLRRGVSHAGLSKASGGARWKIQNSSRGSRCCKQDTVACQVADFYRLVRLGFFRILWAQHVSGLGSSCTSSEAFRGYLGDTFMVPISCYLQLVWPTYHIMLHGGGPLMMLVSTSRYFVIAWSLYTM